MLTINYLQILGFWTVYSYIIYWCYCFRFFVFNWFWCGFGEYRGFSLVSVFLSFSTPICVHASKSLEMSQSVQVTRTVRPCSRDASVSVRAFWNAIDTISWNILDTFSTNFQFWCTLLQLLGSKGQYSRSRSQWGPTCWKMHFWPC